MNTKYGATNQAVELLFQNSMVQNTNGVFKRWMTEYQPNRKGRCYMCLYETWGKINGKRESIHTRNPCNLSLHDWAKT